MTYSNISRTSRTAPPVQRSAALPVKGDTACKPLDQFDLLALQRGAHAQNLSNRSNIFVTLQLYAIILLVQFSVCLSAFSFMCYHSRKIIILAMKDDSPGYVCGLDL